jgi:hypothetical protein
MRRICCYCGGDYGESGTDAGVTHGICPDCNNARLADPGGFDQAVSRLLTTAGKASTATDKALASFRAWRGSQGHRTGDLE